MREFVMPRVALDDDEQMLLTGWLVKEGAEVHDGDPALEVETSKASMEVEVEHDGVVALCVRRVGDSLSSGDLIAVMADLGEQYDLDALRARYANPSSEPVAEAATESALDTRPDPERDPTPGPTPEPMPDLNRRPASVPTAPQNTSEPDGAQPGPLVSSGFLVAAATTARVAESPTRDQEPTNAPATSVRSATERPLSSPRSAPERLSRHRAAVSRVMTASALIPQFSVQLNVNVVAATDLVTRLRRMEIPATLTDVFSKAAALSLLRHPALNAWLVGDMLERHEHVSISLATDGPTGVIAPVIHGVESLDWAQLAITRKQIVDGARTGWLQSDQLSGGTFSISNVGPLGGDLVVPMLTPPQVAILGLGRVRPSGDGRQVLTAALVADHRALDGADAARFLNTFAEILGDSDRLLLADPSRQAGRG